ncbi:MAG: Phenylalanine-tRNA ligase beta subunit [Candidatus Adlerbacteria bacterium GW2011_GWA1_54_10]|uniref:phenylalanine--tRNA ligase n=1 Tax=Candidatus Adlerbacteria bacterium GW2011_GWA1_54_10 TaxID=1618605 RepID=A0A0G2A3B6_9BACT|nr:MAG: Phenylalanine-tRNA ligase beta subunit [Candidatus Adlerbacteria bacterium GW2011_GWA1_54_10]
MRISRKWLEKFFDAPLPEAQKIVDALTFHAFEIESVEKVAADDVLDVKVTPNRGHDCLCHRGIAKELSAILNIPLTHDPLSGKSDLPAGKSDLPVSVSIKSDLCRRYIAVLVRGVKVGPSPKWLRERLEAVGARSINNIVDATNFVMLNIGQPLHAFDISKIKSQNSKVNIEVREENGRLMITDGHADKVLGVAGVKGGPESLITESTTDVILESANFDGISVRKTSAALKLRTDASQRFEQGIPPELAGFGALCGAEMIQNLAGGEIAGFVDVYPRPQERRIVSVTLEKINKVLGTDLSEKEVSDAFARLGLKSEGNFTVRVPFERLDLEIPEDLIEEVARIVGYDKIPALPLEPDPSLGKPPVNPNFYAAEKTRDELMSQGYSEVYTSVFAERGERAVLNKVGGGKPYLRDGLIPGLRDALERNSRHKDILGLKKIKLFEIGTVWKDGEEKIALSAFLQIPVHRARRCVLDCRKNRRGKNNSKRGRTTARKNITVRQVRKERKDVARVPSGVPILRAHADRAGGERNYT